jgi:hypothetical protein
MGYLGNTPGESFISFAKQVFTIVNSQTAYTLDFSVVDENELRLVINNVVQEPGSGKAYTASGTTLTLSTALTNGTDEMYCVFLGKARETVTVPTITKDKLNLISTSSSAGLEVKGDGTTDGTLQLNCSQNSHGIKLASPPHSAGQSYTLTFPQSISADTFLKTDGSGNLSFASAGGANTPAFFAYLSANQSIPNITTTKIQIDTETFDTDNVYDNSTNYRFTPGVAGKYLIFGQVMMDGMPDQTEIITYIYKNDTNYAFSRMKCSGSGTNSNMIQILDTANTTDYYDIRMYQSGGSSKNAQGSNTFRTFFGANKIIE